jgi:hypothetical protein
MVPGHVQQAAEFSFSGNAVQMYLLSHRPPGNAKVHKIATIATTATTVTDDKTDSPCPVWLEDRRELLPSREISPETDATLK